MFYKTLSFWMLLYSFSGVLCETGTPCKLSHLDGTCISIKSCKFAMSMLAINDVQTLRSMFCGFNEKLVPQVCCPLEKNTAESTVHVVRVPIQTTTVREEYHDKIADNEVITPSPPRASNALPSRDVCGQVQAQDRIVGGNIAEIDEFPWIARIKFYDPSTQEEIYACGGSLISDRYVLTAAHCLQVYKSRTVRLGEWDTESLIDCDQGICNHGPVDIEVEKEFVYPFFNRRIIDSGDIALLRLARPVNFTDFIQPICLPTTEYIARQDYIDSTYVAAGWGITEFGEPSELLRKVYLDAVQYDLCTLAIKQLPKNSDPSVICAGGKKNRDTCQGDSGGPLFRQVSENYKQNWHLYGITSYGVAHCGTAGKPTIYTRVTKYMDWIIRIINEG